MVAPNCLFHYNILGVACCTTAKNSPCGLSSGVWSSNPHYPCSIPLFSSLVVVSSLKSKFICCCKYFSAYHLLYDFPETHQSNMFSAIMSSSSFPSATPLTEGLSKNTRPDSFVCFSVPIPHASFAGFLIQPPNF